MTTGLVYINVRNNRGQAVMHFVNATTGRIVVSIPYWHCVACGMVSVTAPVVAFGVVFTVFGNVLLHLYSYPNRLDTFYTGFDSVSGAILYNVSLPQENVSAHCDGDGYAGYGPTAAKLQPGPGTAKVVFGTQWTIYVVEIATGKIVRQFTPKYARGPESELQLSPGKTVDSTMVFYSALNSTDCSVYACGLVV